MSDATKGKSIRLFLVDGTPQSMMTAEIMNWTGHVLMAPRSKITELVKRPEMSKTGMLQETIFEQTFPMCAR